MSYNEGQIEMFRGFRRKAGIKAYRKMEYARKMRRLPIGEEYKIGKYKGYS